MAASQFDRLQQDLLNEVRHSPGRQDPTHVIRLLDHLLDSGDAQALDPAWREIWENLDIGQREHRFFPSNLIKRIQEAISNIGGVDPEIESIPLAQEDHVCLLLGAGASAPEPSSIPTVATMLPELWRRARKIGREDLDRLAEWCERREIRNIEDLLTAAYISNFAAKHSNVTGLLDYFLFTSHSATGDEIDPYGRRRSRGSVSVDVSSIALLQDTLQVLFGLLTGTMLPAKPNPGHDAIVDFVKQHPNSSIVTTNYDGCIDEALVSGRVPTNTYVDESVEPQGDSVDLVKIHGSINWTYCDSCHEVKEFDLTGLKKSYRNDSHSYAVIGICKNCGGQRRPLLIPPIGFKFIMFPNLIRLWNKAREVIESAKYIVVAGYSFSEADTYINKIIARSMNINSEQRLIVADTNYQLVPSLRQRYSAHIDEFDTNRILQAVGSADESLPEVLTKLQAPPPKPSTNGKARQRKPRNRSSSASS